MINRIRNIGRVSAYQGYQITRLVAVILISILLVKAGYSKDQVSHYERFIFMANLFSFFWVMGVKNACLSWFPKLSEVSAKAFFFNIFIILQICGIVFGILLYFSSSYDLIGGGEFSTPSEKWLLAGYLFLYAPTMIIEVLFILKEKARQLLNYGLVFHSVQFILIGLGAWLGLEVKTLFLFLFLWMFIKWIYTLYLVRKHADLQFNWLPIRKFTWFSIPIIAHILLGNGMEFVDGMLVNRFFESDQFALFRYGARELPVLLLMVGALSSTVIPVAVNNAREAAGILKKHSLRLMHLFYPVSILLIFISPFLFNWFYSEDYLVSAEIFNIYLLIVASRIIIPEVFIYGKHQNRLLMWVSLGELLLNLGFSLALLPVYGLKGIALATVLAFMVSKIFMAGFVWKRYHLSPGHYIHLPQYIAYTIMLYFSFLLSLRL